MSPATRSAIVGASPGLSQTPHQRPAPPAHRHPSDLGSMRPLRLYRRRAGRTASRRSCTATTPNVPHHLGPCRTRPTGRRAPRRRRPVDIGRRWANPDRADQGEPGPDGDQTNQCARVHTIRRRGRRRHRRGQLRLSQQRCRQRIHTARRDPPLRRHLCAAVAGGGWDHGASGYIHSGRTTSSFDMRLVPNSEGLFVGGCDSLAAVETRSLAAYAQTRADAATVYVGSHPEAPAAPSSAMTAGSASPPSALPPGLQHRTRACNVESAPADRPLALVARTPCWQS